MGPGTRKFGRKREKEGTSPSKNDSWPSYDWTQIMSAPVGMRVRMLCQRARKADEAKAQLASGGDAWTSTCSCGREAGQLQGPHGALLTAGRAAAKRADNHVGGGVLQGVLIQPCHLAERAHNMFSQLPLGSTSKAAASQAV